MNVCKNWIKVTKSYLVCKPTFGLSWISFLKNECMQKLDHGGKELPCLQPHFWLFLDQLLQKLDHGGHLPGLEFCGQRLLMGGNQDEWMQLLLHHWQSIVGLKKGHNLMLWCRTQGLWGSKTLKILEFIFHESSPFLVPFSLCRPFLFLFFFFGLLFVEFKNKSSNNKRATNSWKRRCQ